MKRILVCIKAVPVSCSVEVDGHLLLKRDGVNLQWNVADESALEVAFRLKDTDGCVTVLTMGPPKLAEPLSELLARGADRAVLITDRQLAGADTCATAIPLAAAAKRLGPFDLILCGYKAIDGETGQVPGELAAALGMPCVSNAERIQEESGTLRIYRRLENGVQTLLSSHPLLVSISAYTYPLRLAGISGMRRARNTPVQVFSAADLNIPAEQCGLSGSLTRVIAMEPRFPNLRRGAKEDASEVSICKLVSLLREVQP